MRLKKVLSVFLAVVMLFSAASVGITAIAAETNYNAQYSLLADALKNEYVSDLSNYTVTNTIIENESGGFNKDVKGFVYDHRVVAQDNVSGDILKASNRFYYITETLITTTYGIGCYDAQTLIDFVAGRLSAYINSEDWVKYNVDTVLKYFVGNVTFINTNNWYHRFTFVTETSVETGLQNLGSIYDAAEDTALTTRTSVYHYEYQRTYSESGAEAFFTFVTPTLRSVWLTYGDEFGFNKNSDDLTAGLLSDGQASAYMIKEAEDTETVNELRGIADAFDKYLNKDSGWDAGFGALTDADIAGNPDAAAIVDYAEKLVSEYSKETLVSLFGEKLGNMINLAYVFKPTTDVPSRIVRNGASYTLTTEMLNALVADFDALVSPESGDPEVSAKVAKILTILLNEAFTQVQGAPLGFEITSLSALVDEIIQEAVFSDTIINMLIDAVYPIISNIFENYIVPEIAKVAGNTADEDEILAGILEYSGMVLSPEDLGKMLDSKYAAAANRLKAGGKNWENVDLDALSWGVDATETSKKMSAFVDALSAAMGGVTPFIAAMMCEDYKLTLLRIPFGNDYVDVSFSSGGMYENFIVPIFKLLGMSEFSAANPMGYMPVETYDALVNGSDAGYALKYAIEPLLNWVSDELIAKPFATGLNLIPRLIYFLNETMADVIKGLSFSFEIDSTTDLIPDDSLVFAASDIFDIDRIEAFTFSDFAHEVFYFTYLDENGEEQIFYLPELPEAKLLACGTVENGALTVTDPGKVLLVLLRYVFSSIGYKYSDNAPMLSEFFGIDLENDIFDGLSLGGILYNVMLNPDDAICAIAEIIYPDEAGDYYNGVDYKYPMNNVSYRENILYNTTLNPTSTYGEDVKYSKYWTKDYANEFVYSITPLLNDAFAMLGVEGMENGLGGFIENMFNESIFTDSVVNTVFNMVYPILGNLNEAVGLDFEGLLEAAFDVTFEPEEIATALYGMTGKETPAYNTIKALDSWNDLFAAGEAELDWGIADAEDKADAFLKTISALLSPASFVLKYLLLDYDFDVFGLVDLPGYAGYQYGVIALLESLSCPDILTYREYYRAAQDAECGDANVIYYLFSPVLGLLDKLYADPINTILSIMPNFLFTISVGAFNDAFNNILHSVYVLFDVLKPVVNVYDVINGLMAKLSGGALSLTLPLDIEFNTLVSELSGSLKGKVINVNGVALSLPNIDLYTLCVGTLSRYNSADGRQILRLNADGGGELLTALMRIIVSIPFMDENQKALGQIIANLAGEGVLDEYDAETIYLLIDKLFEMLGDASTLDIVLYVVYLLMTNIVPIADTLKERLEANDLTVPDLIDSLSDFDLFIAYIGMLIEDPDEPERPETDDLGALSGLFARIKAFFEKLAQFFRELFSFGQ